MISAHLRRLQTRSLLATPLRFTAMNMPSTRITETTNNFLVLGEDEATACPVLRFKDDNRVMHLESHFTLSRIEQEMR